MPVAQARHVACGLPLDESTRLELLQAGQKNRVAQNVRQSKRGALDKRPGFASLGATRTSGSRTTGEKLASYRNAPVIIDSSATLDVYDAALAKSVNRGLICECLSDDLPLPRGRNESIVQDVVICNGLVVTSYKSYGEVSIANADTGATIASATSLVGGGGSTYVTKLVAFSSRYVVAFVANTAASSIDALILDTTAVASWFTALAAVSAATGGGSINSFSVSSIADRVFVGYADTTNVTLKSYNASGLIASSTFAIGAPSVDHVAIDAFGTVVWVAASHGAAIKAIARDTTALGSVGTLSASVIVATVGIARLDVCAFSTTLARIYMYDLTSAAGTNLAFQNVTISAGACVGSGGGASVRNVAPGSRMFRQGTSVNGAALYMAVHSAAISSSFLTSNAQRLLHVVDCTFDYTYLRPVAHLDPGLVAVNDATSHWTTDASGRPCFAYGIMSRASISTPLILTSTLDASSIKLVRLDFTSTARWQNVEHNGGLFFAGACPQIFDGEQATEVGFLSSPITPAVAAGAGGLAAGTYSYVAVYEDISADGRVVVSGVSSPISQLLGAPGSVSVTVRTLSVTSRSNRSSLRIVLYRTSATGAAPYYRLTTFQNVTTAATITYSDTTTDALLTANPQLYAPNLPSTANESLDRRGPASLRDVTSYNGMLVGIRGYTIVNSGQPVYGEATWFSPVFEQPVVEGGDFTAIDTLDGNIVAFKASSIFVLAGSAPSDNGNQGGLGEPRRVACDVGCTDPRSVVATSLGIFFRSRRGIELFSRAQAVEFIGDPVSTTLASYPTIVSAVLDDAAGLVRFALTNGTTTVDLVFDLALKAWVSVDTRVGRCVSSAMVGGTFYWITNTGSLFQESTTSWLDAGNWVTASFQTGQWNHGPLQEQYVYEMQILVERYSAAGLQVTTQPDYGASASKVSTFSETDTLGKQVLPFRPKPRGESTIVTVSDTPPAVFGTGRGFSFVALSSDMGAVQGTTRNTPRIAGRK